MTPAIAALPRVATAAPGVFVALAASLPWAIADVGWKLHHVAVTREPLAVVAAQLGAGLAALLVTGLAVSALTRCHAWLRPAAPAPAVQVTAAAAGDTPTPSPARGRRP